ncbi:unnamed protein product [Ambrosiozyma monospora]|uniref:Unnamed protein product n=1 Tax=Ambrosiozyma monospora TaxID=43982 RepID=A0ACB5SUJ1_AMBMO|nr:unnamed protein product [Ambrosiozyma monospora]
MTQISEESNQDNHEWNFYHTIPNDQVNSFEIDGVKGEDTVLHCQVEFQYLKLENLGGGFTIKEKLLGIMYGEIQNDPAGRKAAYVDVRNRDASEEGFTTENLQQRRDEMARDSIGFFLPTLKEYSNFSERKHYWGVIPHSNMSENLLQVISKSKHYKAMKVAALKCSNSAGKIM